MKTKTYLEKGRWEKAKQSGLEELRSSQSSCTRPKVLVRQRGGHMQLLARWDMMMMIFLARFTTFAIAHISS